MIISDEQRFDTSNPNLCPALRWKGQFTEAEPDPTVPNMSANIFWCMHTQTCIGPDGRIAEPMPCSSKRRKCHGTGECG